VTKLIDVHRQLDRPYPTRLVITNTSDLTHRLDELARRDAGPIPANIARLPSCQLSILWAAVKQVYLSGVIAVLIHNLHCEK